MSDSGEEIERIAEIEHEQWIAWSKDIAKTENIKSARLERWQQLWRPYSELTEEEKELDREWARKVYEKLKGTLMSDGEEEKKEFPNEAITAYQRGQKDGYDRGYFQARGELLSGKADGYCFWHEKYGWFWKNPESIEPHYKENMIANGYVIKPVRLVEVKEE